MTFDLKLLTDADTLPYLDFEIPFRISKYKFVAGYRKFRGIHLVLTKMTELFWRIVNLKKWLKEIFVHSLPALASNKPILINITPTCILGQHMGMRNYF